MNRPVRILVIGNYPPDRLLSMERYSDLLVKIYSQFSVVRLIRPPSWVGSLPGLPPFARQYIAYIDKFLLSLWLLAKHKQYDVIHVSDHGYAYYSLACPFVPCIVTCHDLLAVRGAKGDRTSATGSSPIGIWLQRLIMAGLRHADAVVFVSQATFSDFQRLIGAPRRQRHAVIPNPLNAPFTPDPAAFPLSAVEAAQIPTTPFLLMVGNALPRKNRVLALQLIQHLGVSSPYRVVFAGAPLTDSELAFQVNHALGTRLISIPFPSHCLLNRLYCQAHALLFPSFTEGFGWPLLEAQTCHCPVIASTSTSLPEVAGDGALYADPTDVTAFASHVHALEDPSERERLISLGLVNLRRYDPHVVLDAYRRFAFEA